MQTNDATSNGNGEQDDVEESTFTEQQYFERKDTKESSSNDVKKTKTNDANSNGNGDQDDKEESTFTEHQYFECKISCSEIQKTFSSEDAFQLHKNYFHSEGTSAPDHTE